MARFEPGRFGGLVIPSWRSLAYFLRLACRVQPSGFLTLLIASVAVVGLPAAARPLLLISVDGLRPLDVSDAASRGLHVRTLRALLADGSYADGVRGVLPTDTSPSHVTLVTGVSPAQHGVYNNLTFNPANPNHARSYDLATDIKTPTLWDAAHARGISTASVNWPVSRGSSAIDFDISNDAADDEQDLRIAEEIIKDGKPGFITVHFEALDSTEHHFGPGSPEANAALETIDGYIGQLVTTAQAVQPATVVAVVSDHGFTAVKRQVNLVRAFIDAGLVRVDAEGRITSWDAAPWNAGGLAAIVLARPDDAALTVRVAALLDKLKADPTLGIEEVYGAAELARRGGFPGASFGVSFQLDTTGPSALPISQPLVGPSFQKGTHGHAASHPELYSTFIIAGPGVASGRDLGLVDLRAIAPTLATVLGVALPDAQEPALAIAAP